MALARKSLWCVAQIISGGLVFYGGGMVLAFFMQKEMGGIPFLLFTVCAPTAFALLTIMWHELRRRKPELPQPELSLIVGSVIFMPVYSEVASLLIFKPRPIVSRDILKDLFWYYIMFPVTLTLIGAYTATLGALVLTIVSTLITGKFLRKRMATR